MGRSIAIGVPAWQSVATPFFKSVWEDLEIPPGTRRKVIEGNLVAEQHERIARWFLEETQAEVLLVLEQDHRFPPNLLERVANYTDPVVGALYWTRNEPHFPVALVPKPECWEQEGVWEGRWDDVELTPLWYSLERRYIDSGGLNSVCAVGMGCMAIQREVLDEWPKSEPFFANHHAFGKWWTDDVWFCCRARQLGFGVYVDCDVRIPHMALVDVDERKHVAYLERRATELNLPIPR